MKRLLLIACLLGIVRMAFGENANTTPPVKDVGSSEDVRRDIRRANEKQMPRSGGDDLTYRDIKNERVGIGTTSPVCKLDVDGDTCSDSLSMNGQIDMNGNKIVELGNGSASSDAAAFGQIPVVATQAQQESSTMTTVYVSPSVQHYHPSAPKAWVVFSGTGTVAILASYNVSSITDEGVGSYTINLSTPMSSANYAVSLTVNGNGAGAQIGINVSAAAVGGAPTLKTTSALRINTGATFGGTNNDATDISAVFFGDQ